MGLRNIGDQSSDVRALSQYASDENINYPYTYPFTYYDCQEARDIGDQSSDVRNQSDPEA